MNKESWYILGDIYLYEKWGKDNVLKTKELVNFLLENKDKFYKRQDINFILFDNEETPVKIREYINIARNWGYGIIASKFGYCLTTNKDLLNKYIESREAELRSEQATLNNMKLWDIEYWRRD